MFQRVTGASYILADSSKFKKVFPVTFASIQEANIITDMLPDTKYSKLTNVYEAGERKWFIQ